MFCEKILKMHVVEQKSIDKKSMNKVGKKSVDNFADVIFFFFFFL